MTASGDQGGTSASARPALARLCAVPVEEFAASHWGAAPLLSHGADLGSSFEDLFSNGAVDELISHRGLRAPFLRVAKDGRTLSDKDFTRPGGVGATIGDQLSDDRLLELFAGGSTLVLQALHRTWGPIIDFAGQLGTDLGHPVQVNAYVTPAQSTGFSSHYDVHDVFVVQISGEKRWSIREPVHALPLRSQPWEQRREAVAAASQQPPVMDVVLRPGDCLYLPRGYLHAASALGDISTHLTIGVHAWTRTHLIDHLCAVAVGRLAHDVTMRASLPLGLEWTSADPVPADDIEHARTALIAALRDIPAADLGDAMATAQRRSARAAPVAPVQSVLASGDVRGHQTLVLREHLAITATDADGGHLRLTSRAGVRTISPEDAPAVRKLLSDKRITADTLGLDLARRLILAGLAVVRD